MTEDALRHQGDQWRIRLLGGLCAERADRVVSRFRTQKVAGLLAYLACYIERSHSREKLADLFWPESEPEAGRKSLNQALVLIRRALDTGSGEAGNSQASGTRPLRLVVLSDRTFVRLNPAIVRTDVEEFQQLIQRAKSADCRARRSEWLQQAIACYAGDLLPDRYDDWVARARERLLDDYVNALGSLAESCEQSGDVEGALTYALKMVDADRLREESHRYVIRSNVALGRMSAARRQFKEFQQISREELGLDPSDIT